MNSCIDMPNFEDESNVGASGGRDDPETESKCRSKLEIEDLKRHLARAESRGDRLRTSNDAKALRAEDEARAVAKHFATYDARIDRYRETIRLQHEDIRRHEEETERRKSEVDELKKQALAVKSSHATVTTVGNRKIQDLEKSAEGFLTEIEIQRVKIKMLKEFGTNEGDRWAGQINQLAMEKQTESLEASERRYDLAIQAREHREHYRKILSPRSGANPNYSFLSRLVVFVRLEIIVRKDGLAPRKPEVTTIKSQAYQCEENIVSKVASVADIFTAIEETELTLPGAESAEDQTRFWYHESDGIEPMPQEEIRGVIGSRRRDAKPDPDALWNERHFFRVPEDGKVVRVWVDVVTERGGGTGSETSAGVTHLTDSVNVVQ
ncbi:hypothetical protein P7C70_g3017, partial [Phenoliferia sp. Uapishka_3]